MMIFDNFPARKDAEAFAAHVKAEFGRDATVYDSQADSNKVDVFPFRLEPPIVLVQRLDDHDGEDDVEESAVRFKGQFAGT